MKVARYVEGWSLAYIGRSLILVARLYWSLAYIGHSLILVARL